MFAVILLILRYAFLLLLVVITIMLVKWMASDLSMEPGFQPAGGQKEIKEADIGRLVVISSSLEDLHYGDTFIIDRDLILGRGAGSDIVIGDTYASNQHARILIRQGQYWLEDTGGTNGCFVNEARVMKPVVLADGDRLRVGSVTFQFVRWGHEVGLYN